MQSIVELRFAPLAPDTWKKLGELRRTGWVLRGVENPETVQEHIVALRNLAASLNSLTSEEQDRLLDMLEVHDWPEAICGDEVILFAHPEFAALKATKFEKEQAALASICESLGESGKEILELWLRFETSDDPAAVLARQLDKYQAIEQAFAYERANGIPLFIEFLENARSRLTHPLIMERIQKMEEEFGRERIT